MVFTKQLRDLHKKLMRYYVAYKEGEITQKEYLIRAKIIDREIEKMELSTLLGTSALEGSFLLHSPTRVHLKVSDCKIVSLPDL